MLDGEYVVGRIINIRFDEPRHGDAVSWCVGRDVKMLESKGNNRPTLRPTATPELLAACRFDKAIYRVIGVLRVRRDDLVTKKDILLSAIASICNVSSGIICVL